MSVSLHGPGLWYATRATGLVTLLLLTASVLLGILASGGTLAVGRSASGGGKVTVGLGSPTGPPETGRRHGRNRLRLRA
jgi:hypothetical protein